VLGISTGDPKTAEDDAQIDHPPSHGHVHAGDGAHALAHGFLHAGAVAVMQSVLTCIDQKRTVLESVRVILSCGGAAALLGSALNWVLEQVYELLEPVLNASFAEVLSAVGLQPALLQGAFNGLLGGAFGVFVDMGLLLTNARTVALTMRNFLTAFLDSLFVHSGMVVLGLVTCGVLPAFWSVVVLALVGFCVGKLREKARTLHQSVIGSLWAGLAGIPMMLWRSFVPAGSSVHVPEQLTCTITRELLVDPVFFRGLVVERAVAERQVATGRDFYNVAGASLADVVAMPELRALVRRFARLYT
jgi:hypothetical protein